MSHTTRSLSTIALAALTAAPALAAPTHFTLLHLNDTHSHVDAFGAKTPTLEGTLGGIARVATVVGTTRATEPNVLFLHAGDLFQGDPFFNAYFGIPELQILRDLGLDAMTVGNHEFDLGPDVLLFALGNAFASGGFPVLSANLDLSGYPALGAFVTPTTMKTVDGVKIGIFGLTVPDNPTNRPAPVVVRREVVAIAQAAAADLRAAGADVVILLSHLGVALDREVVAQVRGLDLIVGGHDHLSFDPPLRVNDPDGRPVPIVQAGEHGKQIGRLRFTWESGQLSVTDYALIALDESVPPEPTVQAVVDSLKPGIVAQFGDLYGEVLGTATNPVTERFDPRLPLRDTPLGNLVTDAYRTLTGTDLAAAALGLISESLPEGPLVGADVFRAMSYGYDIETGFGFRMAKLDLRGAALLAGMEVGLSQLGGSDDFFLQYSGLRFVYDPTRPVGSRVDTASIRIGDDKWDPAELYSMTVNTGILFLLTQLGIPVENVELLPDLEYHVVRDYVVMLDRVSYHSQGRIRERVRPVRRVDPLTAPMAPAAAQLP